MKSIIAALLVSTCGMQPAYAQDVKCYEVVDALNKFVEGGYEITFGDTSGGRMMFLLENGEGGWYFISVNDDTLCVHATGPFGVHSRKPPNA